MNFRRWVGLVPAAVVLAAVIAACGSSSSASSSAPAAAPKVSGPSFNLGAICSCSGLTAAALADVKDGSTVWVDSVNAAGGVNGHPVKLTLMDDGGNPATGLQDVKQLVQYDHIQALVGDESVVDGSFAS
ncbi:MAG: ABC transporter substrate-binding protein [Terriglobales bacterium]